MIFSVEKVELLLFYNIMLAVAFNGFFPVMSG